MSGNDVVVDEREVICEECNYVNCAVNDDMRICGSCGWSLVNDHCETCGYSDNKVKKGEDGVEACENCMGECGFCGEERGLHYIQVNDERVCSYCLENEGEFCASCGGFYCIDDIWWDENVSDESLCTGCFEYEVEERKMKRCKECGLYNEYGEIAKIQFDDRGNLEFACSSCVGGSESE